MILNANRTELICWLDMHLTRTRLQTRIPPMLFAQRPSIAQRKVDTWKFFDSSLTAWNIRWGATLKTGMAKPLFTEQPKTAICTFASWSSRELRPRTRLTLTLKRDGFRGTLRIKMVGHHFTWQPRTITGQFVNSSWETSKTKTRLAMTVSRPYMKPLQVDIGTFVYSYYQN